MYMAYGTVARNGGRQRWAGNFRSRDKRLKRTAPRGQGSLSTNIKAIKDSSITSVPRPGTWQKVQSARTATLLTLNTTMSFPEGLANACARFVVVVGEKPARAHCVFQAPLPKWMQLSVRVPRLAGAKARPSLRDLSRKPEVNGKSTRRAQPDMPCR